MATARGQSSGNAGTIEELEAEEKSLLDLSNKVPECQGELQVLQQQLEQLETKAHEGNDKLKLVQDQQLHLELEIHSCQQAEAKLRAETEQQVEALDVDMLETEKHIQDLKGMLDEAYQYVAAGKKPRRSQVSR
ncbi:unnamed protein product [Effrenium voratum]|nr:unnamed protein product [Effrenium voratum]